MRQLAFVMLLSAASLPGRAAIYECIDQNGYKRFTTIAAKDCKMLNVGLINTAPATSAVPAAPRPQGKTAAIPTPVSFPRVDSQTQQNRDNERRRILEQEFSNEQKLLDQAKKELSEQESIRLGSEPNSQRMLDRLEPYRKKVKLHDDNVGSLRREISKTR